MGKNAKGTGKKKLGIGIVVVAIVLVLVGVFAGARIENAVRKMVSSPESYYQWVEKQMIDDVASLVAQWYEKSLAQLENSFDTGYKTEVEVVLSEVGQDVISLLTGVGAKDLSWLSSSSIAVTGALKDTKIQSFVEFAFDKQKIMSVDVIMDYAQELLVYFAVPELSKKYIGIETGVDAGELGIEQSKQFVAILQKELPDSKTVEQMLSRYFSIIIKELNRVEKADDILKVEHIAQKCTKLEVTVDELVAETVLEALIKELKEDMNVKKYMVAIADACKAENINDFNQSGEEIYEDFLTFLDDLENEVDNLVENQTMVMDVFVDSYGAVIAREVEVSREESTIEFGLLMPRDKKEVAVNAYVIPKKDGNKYAIVGISEVNGGNINGDFAIEYDGTEIVNINAKDVEIASILKGNFHGLFTMQMPNLIGDMVGSAYLGSTLSELQFILDTQIEESYSNIELSVVNAGEEWLKIATISEIFEAEIVVIPTENTIVAVEKLQDLKEYWDSIEWETFIEHIKNTPLNNEYIDIFEALSKLTFEELYRVIYLFGYSIFGMPSIFGM